MVFERLTMETTSPVWQTPFVIFCGTKNFFNPNRQKSTGDIPELVRRWVKSRASQWPLDVQNKPIAVSWSKGPVLIQHPDVETQAPVEGFMLYASFPAKDDFAMKEISFLCEKLLLHFGQISLELHASMQRYYISRNEVWKSPGSLPRR